MFFLRKVDYFSKIREDNLDVILKDKAGAVDESFLIDCQLSAEGQVQSYLRHLYDVPFLFRPVEVYDNARAYVIGDFVAAPTIDDDIFTAIADGTGNDPTTPSSTFWVQSDPRDPTLKMFTIDITLYHLHSRINPRNIPDLRLQRRDEATKWLEMVSKGMLTPAYKKADPTPAGGQRIIFGTKPKQDNSW